MNIIKIYTQVEYAGAVPVLINWDLTIAFVFELTGMTGSCQ